MFTPLDCPDFQNFYPSPLPSNAISSIGNNAQFQGSQAWLYEIFVSESELKALKVVMLVYQLTIIIIVLLKGKKREKV